MALEKQAVGIYVSGHPLDGMKPLDFMVIDLDEQEGQWVDVLVVVSEVEVRYTRTGRKWDKCWWWSHFAIPKHLFIVWFERGGVSDTNATIVVNT